jgi:hypothetical protein
MKDNAIRETAEIGPLLADRDRIPREARDDGNAHCSRTRVSRWVVEE